MLSITYSHPFLMPQVLQLLSRKIAWQITEETLLDPNQMTAQVRLPAHPDNPSLTCERLALQLWLLYLSLLHKLGRQQAIRLGQKEESSLRSKG